MKTVLFALALLIISPATSQAAYLIGTDLADAQSASPLNLELGSISTLDIWLTGDNGQNIRALSFNLNSDAPGVVNSSNLLFDDLLGRWPLNNTDFPLLGQSPTGLLVDDAQGATLGSFAGTGVTFTDSQPFVRLGTIDLSADSIGTANLEFSDGSNNTADQDGTFLGFGVGGRTVNVTSSIVIPEPSSLAALAAVGVAGLVRRRRRR
jgi:hypothetical protein